MRTRKPGGGNDMVITSSPMNGKMKPIPCILLTLCIFMGCMGDVPPEMNEAEIQDGETVSQETELSEQYPECDFHEDEPPLPAEDMSITVIYDNNEYDPRLETDWGFSCLIRGCEKTILFDTGTDGHRLLRNMEKLDVDPGEIDVIVLSHIHGDHTGGLATVLRKKSSVIVYVLQSFPFTFKEQIREYGAEVIAVSNPVRICPHVYSTGEIGGLIDEQSLVIETDRGLVVITGCAHPGIVLIIERAHDLLQTDLYFVMGGFHLNDTERTRIETIISDFERLGVRYAGPCHCSGNTTRELFENAYGQHYISIGAGTVIYLREME